MASQYPKNVVTKKGLALISECIATNKQLVFTKVIVGDGDLPPNQDVSTMLNAISPKMELPITKAQNEGNGQFLVRATISNSKLDIGFFPKEVALFAKAEGGTEILYAYTNGGDKVGFVPDKSIPIESEIYNVRTIIGAVTNVKAEIKDETFVTVLDLREAFTDDTSSIDDDEIESNSLLASLGARVSYVKKYVKKAISDAFKSDDFDDNVIRAIGKKTFEGLGVQARFSNANSWFICFGPLFFGLIIQGGSNAGVPGGVVNVRLPIAYVSSYIIIGGPTG
ncbi:hypothetical protein, partial [Veillonella sp.]|uniref:hypothetical protein n=1 Tax=Veillonella sp. TaxID=1926307 RepID=UPI0025FF6D6D